MNLKLSDECEALLNRLSDILGISADRLAVKLLEERLREELGCEAWNRLKEMVVSGKGFSRSVSEEELQNIRSVWR